MSKFTTTLKGLMALALGSFTLGASASEPPVIFDNATRVEALPAVSDNGAVYIIQSQDRGGFYADAQYNEITHCGENSETNAFEWHNDIAVSATDANQQFAIINYLGQYYLYSVGQKKFITFQAIENRTPKGVVALSATDITNAAATIEIVEYDNAKYFTFRLGGYLLNHLGGYAKDVFKGVGFINTGIDPGNRYVVQKLNDVTLSDTELSAAMSAISGPIEQTRTEQIARLNDIRQFYHNSHLLDTYIQAVQNATSEATINSLVNEVFNSLDGKIVYLMYAPNENSDNDKYLGVIGVGNNRIATLLPERGARAKWQLHRVPDTYQFRLVNTASDTYITTKFNNGTTAVPESNFNYFEVEFKNNTATENAVALKYFQNHICLTVGNQTIGGTTYPNTLKWTADNVASLADAANAWKIIPTGLSLTQLASLEEGVGGYFVIRSNRALTATPNSNFADTYPGSLLGCYTPDREKARNNATEADNGMTFSNGIHVRQFLTGMQTIWKIVPQAGGGYKIYSIMGEGENDAPLMGMTFGDNQASDITITDNPTTVYFIDPISFSGYVNKQSPLPNGIVISSVDAAQDYKCFHVYNSLLGDNNGNADTADFYVKANFEDPTHDGNAKTNQAPIFYIERVSSTDVDNAKDAFKDYAKNHRMFELLKNVLNEDEIDYALAEKASMNPDDINSVAKAREYLNLGDQAASTRAFEQLDGKVIRLRNRMDNGAFFMNHNSSLTYLTTDNSGVETGLDKLWIVEVVSPELRQFRLRNYMTNKYIQPMRSDNGAITMVDGQSAAGVYTVSRYYSLDGKSFYANLLGRNDNRKTTAIRALNTSMNQQKQLMRGAPAALGCHWTLENAAADDVKNTQLDLTINDKGDLISIKPAEGGSLAKTANFPAAYTVKLTPKAVATPADADATTPTEVVVPEANITAATDGSGFDVNLDGLNVPEGEYTLNFPVGYFTANGKLAPALSKEVKVEDTTSIREVNAAEKGAEVIYDLQGRRVSKASKGVYIINGVKTLVK